MVSVSRRGSGLLVEKLLEGSFQRGKNLYQLEGNHVSELNPTTIRGPIPTEEPRHHPGYFLVHSWELEITRPFKDRVRGNTEKIILAVNGFNLPERASRTFQIIWGPGFPAMTYPGPVDVFTFQLDITNFYTKDIVDFLILWHEDTLIDFLPNLHDGHVIGYDEDRVIRSKWNVLRMWPTRISMGDMSRDVTRQRISATLACWDIRYDFDFDKFEFEEGCMP